MTSSYTETGGKLHIDVDGNALQQSDRLTVGNIAKLGGNLTVNTLNRPSSSVDFLTYSLAVNDFASFTYLGGVTYTPFEGLAAYTLIPN